MHLMGILLFYRVAYGEYCDAQKYMNMVFFNEKAKEEKY